MTALRVSGLYKAYPAFRLQNVGFTVRPGSIMGFIGRNGAGKTTTLKALQNLIHPDSGDIRFFGQSLYENEAAIKQQISFALGGADYYRRKRLSAIAGVYSRFYIGWDAAAYRQCLEHFALDETKRIQDLSEGMKVKFALALALSHKAQLIILDEPTSGLDPVSRDELLEVFLNLVENTGAAILFSTHITSDLEKCADDITYIANGQVLESGPMADILRSWRLVSGHVDTLTSEQMQCAVGLRSRNGEFNAMLHTRDEAKFAGHTIKPADLEALMVYTERGLKL